MNILLLADPKSHDIKWIEYITKQHNCIVLLRNTHYKEYSNEELCALEQKWDIKVAGSISDFSLIHFQRSVRSYRQLTSIIAKYKIDIFHIMYAEPNSLWALFKEVWKVPIIITTRGTDVLKTIPSFFSSGNYWQKVISRLYMYAIKKADVITCTSNSQKESIVNLFNYPDNKIHILRTGVEFKKVINFSNEELPSELKGKNYILFPRSMHPLYNHEFTLRAIQKLSSKVKQQYKFVFVDRDSSDKIYVNKIENQMTGMKDCSFIFLKRQNEEQMFSLYKNAFLIIMNPLSDGTPVSAIEGIAFKKPVIVGPIAYDEELFGHYDLKLKEWSETELASMIEDLVNGNVCFDPETVYSNFFAKADRESQMILLMDVYNRIKKKSNSFITS